MSVVTLQSIQKTLSEYNPISTSDCQFKSVLALYVNADPQPSNEECIQGLQDDLTVEMLFQEEVLRGPTTLFRLLRDYIVTKGFNYVPCPGSNRIIKGIANSFFDTSDKEYAFGCLENLRNPIQVSGSTSQVVSTPSRNNVNQNGEDERKIAHSIAQRFKRDERFTGKLGEDINEFLSNYNEAALDYNLSQSQKFRYVHNLFDGEAKRFFRDQVFPQCDNYPSAAAQMIAEYNNITRQNRVRQYLQGISLTSIMEKESCDTSDGLEKLRNIITRFAPQGPRSYRSEEAKVEYLYNAVAGLSWSKPALTQCYTNDPPWKFQQLYTALDSAWLQEERQKDVKMQDNRPEIIPIHWESQGMYGVPRRKTSSAPVRIITEDSINDRIILEKSNATIVMNLVI